jgi:hypothetical protein
MTEGTHALGASRGGACIAGPTHLTDRMTSVILAPMELVSRLFGEAWDHRRQRHRATVAGLGTIVVVAAIVAGILVGRHQSVTTTALVSNQTSSSILAGSYTSLDPDQQLGNHCAVLNSIACDALTVQLELRRPAASVVASMGTRVVRLTATPKSDGFPVPDEITSAHGSGPWHVFSGELLPAGTPEVVSHPKTLRAYMNPGKSGVSPYVHVRLLITFANGSRVSQELRTHPIRAYACGPCFSKRGSAH